MFLLFGSKGKLSALKLLRRTPHELANFSKWINLLSKSLDWANRLDHLHGPQILCHPNIHSIQNCLYRAILLRGFPTSHLLNTLVKFLNAKLMHEKHYSRLPLLLICVGHHYYTAVVGQLKLEPLPMQLLEYVDLVEQMPLQDASYHKPIS